MTRRLRKKSLHVHRATQRDNRKRRTIRRRIIGELIGTPGGMCSAWHWRQHVGRWNPAKMSERFRSRCLISVRQPLQEVAAKSRKG